MKQLSLNFLSEEELKELLLKCKEELVYQSLLIEDLTSSLSSIRDRAKHRYKNNRNRSQELLKQLDLITI